MLIETIDPLVKEEIANRMGAGELVDFLGISTEETIEVFMDHLIMHYTDIKDLLGIVTDDEEQNYEAYDAD